MSGVKRRVWGYPTPYDELQSDPTAFANDSIYEAKVRMHLNKGPKLANLALTYTFPV